MGTYLRSAFLRTFARPRAVAAGRVVAPSRAGETSPLDAAVTGSEVAFSQEAVDENFRLADVFHDALRACAIGLAAGDGRRLIDSADVRAALHDALRRTVETAR